MLIKPSKYEGLYIYTLPVFQSIKSILELKIFKTETWNLLFPGQRRSGQSGWSPEWRHSWCRTGQTRVPVSGNKVHPEMTSTVWSKRNIR